MKILQVIQKPQFRGAETFACQLSVELKKLGHEVDLTWLDSVEPDKYDIVHIHVANLCLEAHKIYSFQKLLQVNPILSNRYLWQS